MHGGQEVLCECRNGTVGIAPENGMHDGGVLGFDVPGFSGFAPDRKPSIALALLVQDIAKSKQPLRTAGVDQRAVEHPMTRDPYLIVAGWLGRPDDERGRR